MADPIVKDDKAQGPSGPLSGHKSSLAESASGLAKDDAKKEGAKKGDPGNEVPMALRGLIGTVGLALLVGFFFPWVRRELEANGETVLLSGLSLLQQESLAGTPSMAVLIVPVLGTALAAIAFTGFRYTAYVSIGVSVLLFAYAAYVFFQLFVQYTGVGLWITTGAAFLALLLGVGTLLWMRRVADKAKAAKAELKNDPSKI